MSRTGAPKAAFTHTRCLGFIRFFLFTGDKTKASSKLTLNILALSPMTMRFAQRSGAKGV